MDLVEEKGIRRLSTSSDVKEQMGEKGLQKTVEDQGRKIEFSWKPRDGGGGYTGGQKIEMEGNDQVGRSKLHIKK